MPTRNLQKHQNEEKKTQENHQDKHNILLLSHYHIPHFTKTLTFVFNTIISQTDTQLTHHISLT